MQSDAERVGPVTNDVPAQGKDPIGAQSSTEVGHMNYMDNGWSEGQQALAGTKEVPLYEMYSIFTTRVCDVDEAHCASPNGRRKTKQNKRN